MEFRWFCKQRTETFPTNPDNEEEHLYENGDFLPAKRISQSEIDANEADLGPAAFQDGGCFGGGPGINKINCKNVFKIIF